VTGFYCRCRCLPQRQVVTWSGETHGKRLGSWYEMIVERHSTAFVLPQHGRGGEVMSTNSRIEWTDSTWNPVRGCTKISPGCAHCYAETLAERFRGVPGHPYEQGFDLRLVAGKVSEPLTWTKSQMVFVNSMSDLFHRDVPDEYIVLVARVMAIANWHTYQVLTKRSDRLRNLLQSKLAFAAKLPHIWWGVSVENQKHGLPRVQDLREANPAMSFLSIEPLLEDLGDFDLSGINWVIVGGESGAGARPMKRDWVNRIRSLCRAKKVPFFFKQWGGVRKSMAGREIDGRTFDEMPPFTQNEVLPADQRKALVAEFLRAWPSNTQPTEKRIA
jgi:protein gp37